jgi:DNA-binding NarL/FixJ family response regulator
MKADLKKSFPQLNNLKIVICDDDEAIIHIVKPILEKQGCNVCGTAGTGVDSVNQIVVHQPDIVLLDINMPLGSGLTIIPLLREIYEDISIIMLTADNRSESVRTSISLGAKGYIIKQYMTAEMIYTAIAKAIGQPNQSRTSSDTELESETAEIQDKTEQSLSIDSKDKIEQVLSKDISKENAKVLVDDLPEIPKIYITGVFHTRNKGSLHLYHPLTATREEGNLNNTVREILAHPEYFFTVFKKMEGFQEVSSFLFDQGMDGNIYELLLKPALKSIKSANLTFALRIRESSEHERLPLGVNLNGDIYTYNDQYPEEESSISSQEYLLNDELKHKDLQPYRCSFNGLSLETSLFLTVFNINEITKHANIHPYLNSTIKKHITELQDYAKWQEIPKAVVFGSLGLVSLPNQPETNLVVTKELSSDESTAEDRSIIYYWMEVHQYREHLLHYFNRWSLRVVPLLQIPNYGTFSLLTSFGMKNQFGLIDRFNPSMIFNRDKYKSVSIKDLLSDFPKLKLPDLMRPLLLNTFLARYPSMRFEQTMKSSKDVNSRLSFTKELIHGDGLKWVEKVHPYLYQKASQNLSDSDMNESNPDYPKELGREIMNRFNTLRNLPSKHSETLPISEDNFAERVRNSEKSKLKHRFREKYEDT